jgi:tetratricopeptide (TPR) repeat protein
MRIYLLIIAILTFFQTSFSQTVEKNINRYEIDSLKKILPLLHDSDRVDCLNTLAYKYSYSYYDWDWDPNLLLDSCGPIAIEANELARKIRYKKGLGYSYLRMADLEKFKNDTLSIRYDIFDNEHFNKPALDAQEKYLQLAINTGEQINDNAMTGKAYMELCILTCMKMEFKKLDNYLANAVHYFENANKQPQDQYTEYDYADCPGCKGNEHRLAELYLLVGRGCMEAGNKSAAVKYILTGIEHLKKTTDYERMGDAYFSLSYYAMRIFNYELAIEVAKKGIIAYHQAGNIKDEIACHNELSKMYEFLGDFENGVDYCKKSISIAEQFAKNNSKQIDAVSPGIAMFWMCRLYKIAGDYETALEIIRQARKYFPDQLDIHSNGLWTAEIGDVHRRMKNYDSAFYYLKRFDTTKNQPSDFGKPSLAYLYLEQKEYDKALELGTSIVKFQKRIHRITIPLGWGLLICANAYLKKKDYSAGLQNAREALYYLKIIKGKVLMIDNYKLLSEIFRNLGKNDSAYYYLHEYTTLKDSLLNRQFLWKLNSYKKEAEEERKISQINLLNKDNQLQQQTLKQESTLKKGLITGLILLLLLGIFIFRSLTLKRKSELQKQKLESEKKQSDLEMKALRAQMNPHFIFNCLSSINRFILKNEAKTASGYLTRFSRLMRMVLQNSQRKSITLEDELQMLGLYLEMERMRFKNAFDYSINFLNEVEADNIFIPPLVLQPFCENAIWHGLMHKEAEGFLTIELRIEDAILICTITDNGVGREKAENLKSKTAEKEKSMGLKITADRLALSNNGKNVSTAFEIEDLKDESGAATGTKVIVRICVNEMTKELV